MYFVGVPTSKTDDAFFEQMNSQEGDLNNKSIFKIQNTNLTAKEVAKKIIAHYDLKLRI